MELNAAYSFDSLALVCPGAVEGDVWNGENPLFVEVNWQATYTPIYSDSIETVEPALSSGFFLDTAGLR